MGIRAEDGGYVRATSPLRRYADLMVHWQIKSSLGRTKELLNSPFTIEEVQSLSEKMERTSRFRTRMERRATIFWKLFLIHKKLQQVREDPSSDPFASELLLNDGLTGVVTRSKMDYFNLEYSVMLNIPELGIQATAREDPAKRQYTVGNRYRFDIENILLEDYSKMYIKLGEQV